MTPKALDGNRIAEIQAIESARLIAQLQKEKAYLIAELEEYKKKEYEDQYKKEQAKKVNAE